MKSNRTQTAAAMFQALGNPKRVEFVRLLAKRPLTATELQSMVELPQANVSQHLRILKEARVIVAVRVGTSIQYHLSHPNIAHLVRLVAETMLPHRPHRGERHRADVQDIVCGMWVEPTSAAAQVIYKGGTYYFCASGCHRQFIKAPRRYV